MKSKTSYYLCKYSPVDGKSTIISCKTMKKLKVLIKKHMLLRDGSFDVRVTEKNYPKYRKNDWNILPFDIDEELWYYNHITDGVARYKLRGSSRDRSVSQRQRKLQKTMLSFNY